MKILYVNDYLVHAGAEKMAKNIMRMASKHGHETRFVAPLLDKENTPSEQVATEEIESFNPDLVHFHNIAVVGLDPIKYCQLKGIPVVWTVHDWYPVCKMRARLRQGQVCHPLNWSICGACPEGLKNIPNLQELRNTMRDVEIVTLCNAQRLLMGDFDYDVNHITVVKNGVDTEAFESGEDGGYIFWFGLMRWEKAVDWHFQSAQILPYPHLSCGAMRDYKIDIEKCKSKYLGFLPESDMVKMIAHSSLVQVPARWPEPCGLTILESFACGKPVITVALGGIPEYVRDGETGFLVEPGDVVGFLDLTHYLMEKPELRNEMSKNALEASRYYSLERVWSDYMKVYEKAIGGKIEDD